MALHSAGTAVAALAAEATSVAMPAEATDNIDATGFAATASTAV